MRQNPVFLWSYQKFKGQNLGSLSPIFLEAKSGALTRISETNVGAKPLRPLNMEILPLGATPPPPQRVQDRFLGISHYTVPKKCQTNTLISCIHCAKSQEIVRILQRFGEDFASFECLVLVRPLSIKIVSNMKKVRNLAKMYHEVRISYR